MYGTFIWELFSLGNQPHYTESSSFDILNILNLKLDKPQLAPQILYQDVMLKCWESNPKVNDKKIFPFQLSSQIYSFIQKARPDFHDLRVNLSQICMIEKSWLPTKESRMIENKLVGHMKNVIELNNPIYQGTDSSSTSTDTNSQVSNGYSIFSQIFRGIRLGI